MRLNQIICQIISQIPIGKVTTYGKIASLAGYPSHARYVGSTLKKLPKNTKLPWFRVINAQGKISFAEGSDVYSRQKKLLEQEGVDFKNERISLKIFAWDGS